MMPAPAILAARGAVRVLGTTDAAWPPPTSGRELVRADLIGTAGDPPVLILALADDVDPRRVVVFVRLGDLLCSFRPTGDDRDALEVDLPFRLGSQRALVVVVECATVAEAEQLALQYEAARADLEAGPPEPVEEPRSAEPPESRDRRSGRRPAPMRLHRR